MNTKEQFEAWFENDVVGEEVTFPEFDGGEYTEGDLYDDQLYFMLQAMWMAWQAASTALEQQLAALAANNALLKDALLEEGYRYYDAETEVTDAYLAEVRAQGVDMYADTLDRGADDAERDGFDDGMKFLRAEAEGVRKFAAQLRQGAEQ